MHRPGIYLGAPAAGAGRMVMLRPTISSAVKTTGNGSILFPLQLKVLVPRSTSQMIAASARPTFWFYFDPSNRHVGEFGSPDSSAAESPDEFSLVRLRSDGVVRQFVVGRVQPYVSVSGIDAKHAIQFDTTEMSDGIFKVSLGADLEPGEYAFVLVGEKARKAAYRIYDFEVASAR
jgi:hypothetical protein